MQHMATSRTSTSKRGAAGGRKAHPTARTMFALRLPPETLAGLDAWVEALNNEPGRMGRVHRSDLLERIISDAVKAHSTTPAVGNEGDAP